MKPLNPYPITYIPALSHSDPSKFRERQQERLRQALFPLPRRVK